jgi:L-alanine-DL-glutamate epimerase-like enolase superfamily enzyme
VLITTDDGIVGVGGSGRRDAALIRDFIAWQLIGQNPFALERHADLLRQAGGGWIVDMALCDSVAKAAGLPLATLWGLYQNRIRAYASLVTRPPRRRSRRACPRTQVPGLPSRQDPRPLRDPRRRCPHGRTRP